MDDEMRWRVLLQLCRLGLAGEDEIAAGYERDRTNEGEQHAARCRATLPDARAKSAAWQVITQDAEVSNHVLYATCQGFWWPEQRALTDPYVTRYFTEMPATVSLRHGFVVAESARVAYPRFAVGAATVAAADAVIADDSVDDSVRRQIVDGTDRLRRALAARERWLS
jgi:aminopeptidase N